MHRDPVWIVRSGERESVRGSIAIEGDALVVRTEASESRIGGRRITGVRRERATPVLSLSYLDEGGEAMLMIYFSPPPALPAPGQASLLRSRGLERTAGVLGLSASNRRLKPEILGWVEAIRALGSSGG